MAEKQKHNVIKSTLEAKVIPLINAKNVENAERQTTYLHSRNDGFLGVATKQNKIWSQWSVKTVEIQESLQRLLKLKDVYLTPNGFWTTSRKVVDIRHLNAFWVDLDYYNIPKYKGKNTSEMIEILRKNGLFKDIGEPSFYIDSGNGMYIFWVIDSCSKHMLPIWNLVQREILEIFKPFGADPKSIDAAHVLRLAGTINTKTNRYAEFIYSRKDKTVTTFKIQHFIDKLLPSLEDKNSKKGSRPKIHKKNSKKSNKSKIHKKDSKIKPLFTIYKLNHARLEDLKALVELRKGTKMKGCREMILFLYRYWSCCFNQNAELALQHALELNQEFLDPLSEKEVISSTKRAEVAAEIWEKKFEEYINLEKKPSPKVFFRNTGCYIYSNKKLIDILDIKEEEMVDLQTIISTKVKNMRSKDYRAEWKRQQRRNSNGLTSREQAKEDNLKAVAMLLEQGYKQKDIAVELNLTKGRVSQLVKEIKATKESENLENTSLQLEIPRTNTSDLDIIFSAI